MYDKPENKQLSRRERVLLDPLKASKKSDKKKTEQAKEGSFYGYNEKTDNFYPGLDA
ncbi:hypothetical protein N9C44_00775 [bacterium]|jgi:hypothetical protein|nr:hypothetical protein [bacterium]|tara:strand:+ start:583 stop:753 length:171 start_codon:yes stop_codon:yes gene_type:complete